MKRTILIYSLFILSFLVVVPQAFAEHPYYPAVDFMKQVSYKTSAVGEPAAFVDAFDINGKNLFLIKNGLKVPPIIKLGTTVLTVLYSGMITDSTTDQQQVVVQMPSPLISGSYNVDINNGDELGGFIITLGMVGPTGPIGPTGGETGPIGETGPAGTNGTNGNDGATGQTGSAGTNGSDGTNGADGSDGTNGADGSDGAIGATGPAGNTSTKAFVNFNGSGNPVIRAQFGIENITRMGTGEYTITFANSFANINYVMTGNSSSGVVFIRTVRRDSISIYLLDTEGRAVEPMRIMLQFTSL